MKVFAVIFCNKGVVQEITMNEHKIRLDERLAAYTFDIGELQLHERLPVNNVIVIRIR